MLSAIAKFFKRVAMWLFSPNYHLRAVDGGLHIVRQVDLMDSRKPFLVPHMYKHPDYGMRRVLLLIKNMPKDKSWRFHRHVPPKGGDIGYCEYIGKVDGEWCMIHRFCAEIEVTDSVLAGSYYPALSRLPAAAWIKLDPHSVEMIMKAVIIDRWKLMPDRSLSTIIQTFDYHMEVDERGVEGLYASIDGVVVMEEGTAWWAPRATKEYFESLIPREEYVIEAVHDGAPISYTISDCPVDWYVHHIDHKSGEITYVSRAVTGIRSFTKRAVPGSYVHAMAPEQRKAVLSEWAIPTKEVEEIKRMANMSAAELVDPVQEELGVAEAFNADDDSYNEFDELDRSGSAAETVEPYVSVKHLASDVIKIDAVELAKFGREAWDKLPKHDRPIFYRAELREWTFVVEINDFPLNTEVAFMTPGQYSKDGPIEAIVHFRPAGTYGESFVAPHHYPIVEMVPINNVHDCGDTYKPTEIVVTSRGWRYMFRDSFVPSDCVLSNERLVRNNPTGKPLITFEYVYESGPFMGKVAMRRFVVPSQVLRVGANNKRKSGKRQRGTGKRR